MNDTLPRFVLLAALALGATFVITSSSAQAAAGAPSQMETFSPPMAVLFASVEGFKNWFMAQVMATFSYRERMIQMMAVGLFIGLFIMLRKMPGQT